MNTGIDSKNEANINSVLRKTIDSAIKSNRLSSQKAQAVKAALQGLEDIKYIHSKAEEELYQETLHNLLSVPLLAFEAQGLLSVLIQKYFQRLPLFRQSYEIAVLHSQQAKYKKLSVEQPLINLTIPIPYKCPPLIEAKLIGQAQCLHLQQNETADKNS